LNFFESIPSSACSVAYAILREGTGGPFGLHTEKQFGIGFRSHNVSCFACACSLNNEEQSVALANAAFDGRLTAFPLVQLLCSGRGIQGCVGESTQPRRALTKCLAVPQNKHGELRHCK
jgi:hypothetical protein